MKAIKESTLLELAKLTCEYARTGNADLFPKRIEVAKQLSKQAYGRDIYWIPFVNFVEATLGVWGLYPHCPVDEFLELFRAMKFEVLDE